MATGMLLLSRLKRHGALQLQVLETENPGATTIQQESTPAVVTVKANSAGLSEAPPFFRDVGTPQQRNAISEILKQLIYLSSHRGAQLKEDLCRLHISHIIQAGKYGGSTPPHEQGLAYLTCDVDIDAADGKLQAPDMREAFGRSVHFIDDAIRQGGRVLVTCQDGCSSSPAIVIAYLLLHHRLTLWKAFELVYQQRRIIWPKPAFFAELITIAATETSNSGIILNDYMRWSGWTPDAASKTPDAASQEGLELLQASDAAILEGLELLRQHNTTDACWILVDGRVLDVTAYLGRHPGGVESILRLAGRDASKAFAAVGHSVAATFQCGDWDVGAISNIRRLRAAAEKTAKNKTRLRELSCYLDVG